MIFSRRVGPIFIVIQTTILINGLKVWYSDDKHHFYYIIQITNCHKFVVQNVPLFKGPLFRSPLCSNLQTRWTLKIMIKHILRLQNTNKYILTFQNMIKLLLTLQIMIKHFSTLQNVSVIFVIIDISILFICNHRFMFLKKKMLATFYMGSECHRMTF